MNPSFPAFTLRVLPLNYDAVRNSFGCQAISGNQVYASLPFIQVCVTEGLFSLSKNVSATQVSYCPGPTALGVSPIEPSKFMVTWAAWISETGTRYGKFSSITLPDNNGGFPFPGLTLTTGNQVSIGFTSDALPAAVVENDGQITLSILTDTAGGFTLHSWSGVSPSIFSNWQVYWSDEAGGDDLVCYYLDPNRPDSIFARFQRDAFNVEYTINQALPARIVLLGASQTDGFNTQILLAETSDGNNATLTTEPYPLFMQPDNETLGAEIVPGGAYFVRVAAFSEPDTIGNVLGVSLTSGLLTALIPKSTTDTIGCTLGASLSSGIYQ